METKILKRYTNFASLVSILKYKELTLLDPLTWEDQNDTHYLQKYRDKKRFESLYALCFTKASETSHHWKVFASGTDGVCITMDAKRFLSYIKSIKKAENGEVKYGRVKYKLIEWVENEKFEIDELPFLKRYAFRDEKEYRLILGNNIKSDEKSYSIRFEINIIKEITLSNSLPKELRKPIVELLRNIDGCADLIINRSTLNENKRWKKACERAI